ncbi:MAG: O-antigen ligase family protein [Bacteroidota bacterium]
MTKSDAGAVLFFLWAFCSLAYSVNRGLTEKALSWLAISIASYLLARLLARDDSLSILRKILIWAACGTVLYEVMTGIFQGNGGTPIIFSTFYNKNIYGGFLASLLPLIFLGERRPGMTELALEVIYGAIIIAGLYQTFSRGAWLIAAGTLLVLAILNVLRREYWVTGIIIMMVTIGMATGYCVDHVVNQNAITRWAANEKATAVETRSISPRLAYWKNAVKIGLSSPLLGSGHGTFAATHTRVAHWPVYSKYAHNYFLQTFAELGLVGLIAFTFAVLAPCFTWMKNLPFKTEAERRFPFYLAALVLLAHACLDITLDVPEGALWFWLLLGIGCPRNVPHTGREAGKQRWLWVGAYALGLLLLILVGVLQWRQSRIDRLARAVAASTNTEDRIGLLSEALRVRPYDAELLAERALYYRKAGLFQHALADYRAAAKADRNRPGYQLGEAYTLLLMGRKEEARRKAGQALAINPTLPDILEGAGMVLLSTGRRHEGISAIAASILIQGKTTIIPAARARELLEVSLEMEPGDSGRLHLALAMIESELGNYQRASQLLTFGKATSGVERTAYLKLVSVLSAKGYKVEGMDETVEK